MTVLIHTQKEILFKVIAEFFQEYGILCQPYDYKNKDLSASCLIEEEDMSEKECQIPMIILKKNSPTSLLELLQTYQKKHRLKITDFFLVGPYKICPKSRQAFCSKKNSSLMLTEKEVLILKALYESRKPLTKEDLLKHAWGYDKNIDTHTIETHMYKLRKKISPENPDFIIITLKEGYALNPHTTCHFF